MPITNGLALYIHVPFCVAKCPYCGFYSTGYDRGLADAYLVALEKECCRYADQFADRPVDTVYIGGGTPTALSTEQLADLFGILERRVGLECCTEVSVEANPGTASFWKFMALRRMGCTRLSLGVQSLSGHVLRVLGRVHNAEQSRRAVELAREAGFRNIGVDLIYAVPGQTKEEWRETLTEVVRLAPEHVSLYCLSLEEGTRFEREIRNGTLKEAEEDIAVEMYLAACKTLEQAGYEQYELSNFARSGLSCRHNLNYWERGEYIGLGPGAWSFVAEQRRRNIEDVRKYVSLMTKGLSPTSFEERPDRLQAESEYLFLAMRTSRGVDLDRFRACFGKERYAALMQAASDNHAKGLFEISAQAITLTARGKILANSAAACLQP